MYVQKSLILLARKGVRKISFLACEFSPSKIHLSGYPKSLISRINEVYVFFNKISLKRYFFENNINFIYNFIYNRLFCCSQICNCVNMVSVTSASRNITSASCYHPRYHSRSSMYIRGLIPRNFDELAEAVPIACCR